MRTQELHPRTAVVNKTQKNQSKKARMEALTWLAVNFPQSFDNSLRIRPLKIGIMQDILEYADQAAEHGISKSKLRQAVVVFSRRLDYLACLKAKEMRIDLLGNPVAIVTEEEAENAAQKIKKRIEKSARNNRKTPLTQSASNQNLDSQTQQAVLQSIKKSEAQVDQIMPIYPMRNQGSASQAQQNQASKSTSVIIKHKGARQFDPNAVARLKEKLGLSLKAKDVQEAAD